MTNLILLQGALGSSELLRPLAGLLADHFTVHNFNFKGHGDLQPAGDDFSIPGFARELKDFLEERQIQKPHVFGYSMGGYVALYLESIHRGTFDKIITLGTRFDWTPETAAKDTSLLDPDRIREKVPAWAYQLQQLHGGMHWVDLLANTRKLMLSLGENRLLTEVSLEKVINPSLILRGETDRMVTKEESEWAAHVLPHGQYRELTGTPHPIDQVDHDLLASVIKGFL